MGASAQRAKDLFLDALDLPPEERDAFLVGAAGDDPALLERARELLRGHGRAAARPELAGTPLIAALDGDLGPGREVGAFRLVEVLGEGGFGTVWRAEQLRPLRRMVALKVVRSGLGSAQVLARFESERQVLARMDHPAIARVYDAGQTAAGRPFFAMELVRGEPIVRYCESRDLDMRARLALFVELCAALEHAHQKGVLHRDVKPSNVLVQEIDGVARPKVIDFGIAKALEGELAHAATLTGHLVGTPAYASPEQARGAGDVDTRTDVYSLGAVLYELLTGEPPLGSHEELGELGLEELLRRVREHDPIAPSRRAARLGRAVAIPRELDWIALSCLEKDRERRYSSAAALARDVDRFLGGHPVEVAPPSTLYRTRKWVARHRVVAVAAVVAVLAFAGGTVGTVIGLLRARESAAEARAQLEIANHVSAFLLEDMVLAARPSVSAGEGRDLRLVDALAAAVSRLDAAEAPGGRFARAPEVVARVRAALGESLLALGDAKGALPQLEAAAASAVKLPMCAGLEPVRIDLQVADALNALARYADAERKLDELLARLADRPAHDEQVLAARQQRARSVRSQGRLEEAARELESALAIAEKGGEPLAARTTALRSALAIAFDALGRWEEAEALFRRVLADREERLGPSHLSTTSARANLAGFLRARGRAVTARPMLEAVAKTYHEVLGPHHETTLKADHNLALLLTDLEDTDGARALFEDAYGRALAAHGADHPITISAESAFADALLTAGRMDLAAPLVRDAHARAERKLGPEHPQTLSRLKDLSNLYYRAGDLAEAIAMSRRLLEAEERTLGLSHPSTVTTLMNLSTLCRIAGDLDAGVEYTRLVDERLAHLPRGHQLRMQAALELQRHAMLARDLPARLEAFFVLRHELEAHGEEAAAELATLAEEIARLEAEIAASGAN